MVPRVLWAKMETKHKTQLSRTIQIHFRTISIIISWKYTVPEDVFRGCFNFLINAASVYLCPGFINIFLALLHIPNPLLARQANSLTVIHLMHCGKSCQLVLLDNSQRPIQRDLSPKATHLHCHANTLCSLLVNTQREKPSLWGILREGICIQASAKKTLYFGLW